MFQYKWSLIPKYFFTCLCMRDQKTLRRVSKSDYYLNRGIEKLNRDMDIVDWVKKMHNVDIMSNILFTDLQQQLLKFNKTLVIDTESTDSQIDDKYVLRQQFRDIVTKRDGVVRSEFKNKLINHLQ